jgi:hypothetical protein
MDKDGNMAGFAALAMVESLLLMLVDRKLVSREDVRDLLGDAAAAEANAILVASDPMGHRGAVAAIERIMKGGVAFPDELTDGKSYISDSNGSKPQRDKG